MVYIVFETCTYWCSIPSLCIMLVFGQEKRLVDTVRPWTTTGTMRARQQKSVTT